VNSFVALKVRKRQPSVRYAVKYFLRWLGRGEGDLVRARVFDPKREKFFLCRDDRLRLLDCVVGDVFRLVAVIQERTGVRAMAALSVLRRNVRREEDGCVRLLVREKGERFRSVFLGGEFWVLFEPFLEGDRAGYLFLGDDVVGLDDWLVQGKLKSLYNRYLLALQGAAARAGLPRIGTHDFRRSKADELLAAGVGLDGVQAFLGHRDRRITLRYVNRPVVDVKRLMLEYG
jgi:integrase